MELEMSRFYKLSEVSGIVGVPQSTLSRYAREGRIPAQRYGKLWRMSGEAVQYMLEHGAGEPQTANGQGATS